MVLFLPFWSVKASAIHPRSSQWDPFMLHRRKKLVRMVARDESSAFTAPAAYGSYLFYKWKAQHFHEVCIRLSEAPCNTFWEFADDFECFCVSCEVIIHKTILHSKIAGLWDPNSSVCSSLFFSNVLLINNSHFICFYFNPFFAWHTLEAPSGWSSSRDGGGSARGNRENLQLWTLTHRRSAGTETLTVQYIWSKDLWEVSQYAFSNCFVINRQSLVPLTENAGRVLDIVGAFRKSNR